MSTDTGEFDSYHCQSGYTHAGRSEEIEGSDFGGFEDTSNSGENTLNY